MKKKLILPMLMAALIPLLVFSLMIGRAIQQSNEEAGREEADKLARTVVSEIAALEEGAGTLAQSIIGSPVVRETYRKLTGDISLAEELDCYDLLGDVLRFSTSLGDYYNLRIYLPDSALLTLEKSHYFGLSDLDEATLPERMQTTQNRSGWTDWTWSEGKNKHSPVLSKSYWILDMLKGVDGGKLYVAVDIDMGSLQRMIMHHDEVMCQYVLCDSDGEELLRCGNGVESMGDNLYVVQKSLSNGMQLSIELDLSQFTSDKSDYLTPLLYVSLLCMLLIPMVTILILNRQCKELADLAEANLMMAGGKYHRIPENASTREVLVIQQTYNEMVSRIDDLIHHVYEAKIEKQEAQLNSLFEQIKPHFLYNTLESGKWMAICAEDMRTARFLEKLAKYFRVGLSKGAEQVSLRSELEHVRLYVELINMRIADCVRLEMQVEEETLDCPVVRLLLQPIVENAVEHGICAVAKPHGFVRISSERREKILMICVENDGVSMPEELRMALNRGEEMGIGIANIRKRMELVYGEACSVNFYDREGEGTRVVVEMAAF